MATLLERALIEQVGRAEVPGRPMTYGTTPLFLEYFGLRNLEELPAADELRRIPITHPEGLLTADPGLATVPPDQLTLAEVEPDKGLPAPAAEPPAGEGRQPAAVEPPAGQAQPPENNSVS
jgi:segregation and condensation protein B